MGRSVLWGLIGLSAVTIIGTAVLMERKADAPEQEVQPAVADSRSAGASVAEPSPSEAATQAEVLNACKEMAKLGRNIMLNRQQGAPMAEMMEIANRAQPEEVRQVAVGLVMAAYERGQYTTPEIRDRQIREFENDSYLTCMRKYGSQIR